MKELQNGAINNVEDATMRVLAIRGRNLKHITLGSIEKTDSLCFAWVAQFFWDFGDQTSYTKSEWLVSVERK